MRGRSREGTLWEMGLVEGNRGDASHFSWRWERDCRGGVLA